MKINYKSRLQYRIQHILFVILLIACLGFAGWLSNEYNQRSDWTAGKRHSLSQDTINLLSQLPFAISVRSYQTDNPELNKAITEILNRYQSHKDNFSFSLINPDIYITRAKADNIQRYGQTIIEYQGQQQLIDNLSEENITNALIRLHRGKPPLIQFLSHHGERDIKDNSAVGYSLLANQLATKGFSLTSINLLQQTPRLDNAILVMGSINTPLLDTEIEKLNHFIKAGGNILWLQDPALDTSQKSFEKAFNIHFIDGIVMDNNQEISRMLKLSHPAMIPVLEYKRHPITEKMQYYTLFTTATAITTNTKNNNWIATDLLITSDTSWSETGDIGNNASYTEQEDLAGPLSIGLALMRQNKTHEHLSSQRVVVIGDSDFIANNNLGKGANLDFILNTFNWLSQNDKLISIAPKNAPDLQLKLSARLAATLGISFFIVLPLMFFIGGAIIWYKRKKK